MHECVCVHVCVHACVHVHVCVRACVCPRLVFIHCLGRQKSKCLLQPVFIGQPNMSLLPHSTVKFRSVVLCVTLD